MHGLVDESRRVDGANLTGVRYTDPELLAAEAWRPPELDAADGVS